MWWVLLGIWGASFVLLLVFYLDSEMRWRGKRIREKRGSRFRAGV